MEVLTVWCCRFLQIRWEQPEREQREATPPPFRTVTELGLNALRRVLADRARVYLPEHRGAGPCGTSARRAWTPRMIDPNKLLGQCTATGNEMPPMRSLSPLAWSVQHLVPPLQAWYEQKNLPKDPRAGMSYGAKSGGGNGRAALW